MPRISVVFYKEEDGAVPVLEWLDSLQPKALDKCVVRIERLRELGHELRRPETDYLRDGIYELRVGLQHVNYRILYFFHGRTAAVLSQGLAKEAAVPPKEIERAIERKRKFERGPKVAHVSGGLNMTRKRKSPADGVEILHRRYYRGKAERMEQLERARAADDLARKIYELREEAGLTQARLAKMVGTTESVISRLENSDYAGHSLSMLRRIAEALGKRVEIRFVGRKEGLKAA